MPGRARVARWLGWLAAAILALWLAGLVWFVGSSLSLPEDKSAATDAIVVLTGGKLRLEAGLDLLAAGKAKKLFISGVNQKVDRAELLHALGPLAERAACCIVLGREADNTLGNARETAAWLHEEGYRSLRLVTSWYHMPRSLLEFSRAMPQAIIVPHPVYAHHLEPERWWSRHGAPLLVIGEYGKFVAAWLRPLITSVFPSPPTRAATLRTEAAASARPARRAGNTLR